MKQKVLIITILLLGFILRVWGNNFGLPNMLVHSDENEYVSVVKSLVDHTPSPYKIGVPKSSFYYLLAADYAFFRNFIHNSPIIEDYFLFGRLFSALLSTAVVCLWFLTVRNFFNTRLAIWSMLFLALSLIDVQIGHYIKEDTYVQFFGVMSLYFLSRRYKNGALWNLFLSIVAAVLAGSAKINGFLYAIPIGLYLVFFNESKKNFDLKNILALNRNKILVALLIFFAGWAFYINTPISFMESSALKKYSLDALLSPEHEGLVMSSNKDRLPNIAFWPLYLLTTGLGYVLFPLSILGIGVLLKKRKKDIIRLAPIWIMAGLCYFVLSVQTQRFDRWITLITPILALLGAFAVEWLFTKFSKKLVIGIITVGLAWTISIVGLFDWKLSQPDTRQETINYLKTLDKKDILLFLPGLDPIKNDIAKAGYLIYDLPCPPAEPNRYAGMYLIKNDTLFDMNSRFVDSSFYQDQVECVNKLVSHATRVTHFQDPIFNTSLFGPKSIIGPATIRYLHYPQISVYRVNAGKVKLRYDYLPSDMIKNSYQMILRQDQLISTPGKRGTIGGPYITVPAGKYEITIYYDFAPSPTAKTKNIMSIRAYSDTLGTIGKESPVYAKYGTLKKSQFTHQFKLAKPTQIQTIIDISPEYVVTIDSIVLQAIGI